MKTMQELDKAIKSIASTGAKLDQLIQTTGVGVLEHFAEHKDTGLVNRLYQALPNGARKTAFASWLLAYCAVSVNMDAATKKDKPFVYAKDKATDPVGAAQDMWYNHKPEKPLDEVFDVQKAVRALLAKAGKAGKLEHGNGDTLKALAKCVGIPESDVPTIPVKAKAKAAA